jgi:hypothetical protein
MNKPNLDELTPEVSGEVSREIMDKEVVLAIRDAVTAARIKHDKSERYEDVKHIAHIVATISETDEGVSLSILACADLVEFPSLEESQGMSCDDPETIAAVQAKMDAFSQADAICRAAADDVHEAISNAAENVMRKHGTGVSILDALKQLSEAKARIEGAKLEA